MDAPEKIYVNFPFGERHPERGPMVTKQGLNAEDIEYTRTDVFIEKACKFLQEKVLEDYPGVVWEGITEDFKNYMKGE